MDGLGAFGLGGLEGTTNRQIPRLSDLGCRLSRTASRASRAWRQKTPYFNQANQYPGPKAPITFNPAGELSTLLASLFGPYEQFDPFVPRRLENSRLRRARISSIEFSETLFFGSSIPNGSKYLYSTYIGPKGGTWELL